MFETDEYCSRCELQPVKGMGSRGSQAWRTVDVSKGAAMIDVQQHA
jgi:hypothetical protein